MDLISINGHEVAPGTTAQIEIPVARLYTHTSISIPVHVIRGKKPGPKIFICAAIHGDELNGIEIIRRLINHKPLKISKGTLILVPMVNIYGVLNQDRYMPDRRDLNRSFPGSPRGSLAGRVADKFLNEIVSQCDYGIDLHTGAMHRSNLPQIRADLSDSETLSLAEAFGVPVLINANLRDGSLRESAVEAGARILLYEAGEALRFDELSIRAGLRGILNVLQFLGLTRTRRQLKQSMPYVAFSSSWNRAPCSGIVHSFRQLGDQVTKNEVLAEIGTPFGETLDTVKATRSGIVIGQQNIPLVQEGDALFHIAHFRDADDEVAEHIELMQDTLLPDEAAAPEAKEGTAP